LSQSAVAVRRGDGRGVVLARPTPADHEIAAFTFESHLENLWASARPAQEGWGLTKLDSLHVIVDLPGQRADGTVEPYYIKLGAEYYDAFPPTVAFVDPASREEAAQGTRWLPVITGTSWFALHPTYTFPDGSSRQLVCFSFTAQYYMVDHMPPETAVWRQERHTVAATINRLAEVLQPPYYQGPSG
jgi:hypothetical protein